jgi:hypothetical protein
VKYFTKAMMKKAAKEHIKNLTAIDKIYTDARIALIETMRRKVNWSFIYDSSYDRKFIGHWHS